MTPVAARPMSASLPCGVACQHIASLQFDVVIVGAGAAGANCAMAAAARGLRVAIVAKGDGHVTNTSWARGGVAAVLGSDDSFAQHIADTIACGGVLCDPTVVEGIVRGGPEAIDRLVALGVGFDRTCSGDIELGREGGHTRHRIVHSQGDATGPAVQGALTRGLAMNESITIFQDAFALDVLKTDSGEACGLLAQMKAGHIVAIEAAATVLATGGAGQLYRETTNPVLATGDGLAMGLRAGATARNLEFVQFHPTCLYIAGAARILISEIVRGAGGVLRDQHGDRFMPSAHRDAELAPRDVVSRAITRRMAQGGDTSVLLDLTEIDGDPHALFPGISRTCGAFGIDIASDPIPVRPGAHYMIGGLRSDLDGRTNVPGLWAIGECGSTGLHGANRMGSNSLLEGLVVGHRCGLAVDTRDSGRPEWTPPPAHPPRLDSVLLNLTDLVYSLKSLMWRQAGVERRGDELIEATTQLQFWAGVADAMGPTDRSGWELRNMLLLARSIVASATQRMESRGAHYRVDHPDTTDPPRHTDLTIGPCGFSLEQPVSGERSEVGA